MNERIVATELPAPLAAFSHGVSVPAGARLVFVSGQLGVARDGTVPADALGQIRCAWDNIEAVLRAGDMAMTNVVCIRGYVTSREAIPAYRDVLQERLGKVLPASSLVLVAGLVAPQFLVEIEAVAAE